MARMPSICYAFCLAFSFDLEDIVFRDMLDGWNRLNSFFFALHPDDFKHNTKDLFCYDGFKVDKVLQVQRDNDKSANKKASD